MTELGKQVWKRMEEIGWENAPEDFHLEYYENIIECTKQALTMPAVSGSKAHRIAQIQKHLENGDIKFTITPLFESPKLIIGCDLAVEGISDYPVTYYR